MLYPHSNGGLTATPLPNSGGTCSWPRAGRSSARDDILASAFTHVITTYCDPGASAFVPALGLGHAAFGELMETLFPDFAPPPHWVAAQQHPLGTDGPLGEFPDLLQLLLEHRAHADESHRRVAHLVASACMGSDHLWQDLGLPDRAALSELLARHFPMLAARNTGNMKWKKFFYKQLCEREGIRICKAPSCAACTDYAKCFGPEV